MLRFAILVHDHPVLHWDLLVEYSPDEKLKTWRLEDPPKDGEFISAEALPDHRRLYLDYEGPVSGDRGQVRRWDRGAATIVSQTSTQIRLQLNGDRLGGTAELEHVQENLWRFRYTASQADGEKSTTRVSD